MWQDTVLTVVQTGFLLGLMPMVKAVVSGERSPPPMVTSFVQSLGLFTIATTFATLGLYLAASIAACLAVMWTIMGLREFSNKRLERRYAKTK